MWKNSIGNYEAAFITGKLNAMMRVEDQVKYHKFFFKLSGAIWNLYDLFGILVLFIIKNFRSKYYEIKKLCLKG
jgi:hypothetical protein